MNLTEYFEKNPTTERARPLITSIRIDPRGGHAHIRIWSRGGCAGELTLDKDDAATLASKLLPGSSHIVEDDFYVTIYHPETARDLGLL